MYLIDEQDVARPQAGQHPDQIARFLQDGTRRGPHLDAHLPGHEHGQGRLPQAGRAEEQGVVERVPPGPGSVDGDLQ